MSKGKVNGVAQGGQPERSGVTRQHTEKKQRDSRGDAEIAEGAVDRIYRTSKIAGF